MSSLRIVTIDGPAGVGKTTLAKRVADALQIAYLDTGAMFRTLALRLGEGIRDCPESEIREKAKSLVFSLQGSGAATKLCCNNVAVGSEIRTEKVGAMASQLAVIPVVREILKEAQRALGASTPLVVEGRDMGTVVFPRARYKFFLDASPRVRAERRLGELQNMGQEVSLTELEKQIAERDARDRNRTVAPLRPAEDAFCIDTSALAIDEVLKVILGCIADVHRAAGSVPELAGLWQAVQDKKPLVHFITNVVIVNDCANVTLAAGGSPIMADAPEEVAQVTAICSALVLNIGTISTSTALSSLLAGKAARAHGHPVVLDPVGAGISDLRNETLHQILRDVRPQVIKGNISEMRYIAEGTGMAQGVDAAAGDLTDQSNLEAHAKMAQAIAKARDCVAVITGPIDIVADAKSAYAVSNGSAWMGRISGSGCMTAAVLGAYVGASPENPLGAALAAITHIGLAGEKAAERLPEGGGTGTFRTLLLDGVSTLTGAELDAGRQIRRLV